MPLEWYKLKLYVRWNSLSLKLSSTHTLSSNTYRHTHFLSHSLWNHHSSSFLSLMEANASYAFNGKIMLTIVITFFVVEKDKACGIG